MPALTNKRILVTRPNPDNQVLCDLITAEGGNAISLPLIRLEPLDPIPTTIQLSSWINNLTKVQGIITLSPRAAQWGLKQLKKTYKSWPSQGPSWYAIGPKTQQALATFGVTPLITAPSPYNSEALLSLPQLKQVAGQNWIILCGQDGRQLLRETLNTRGANIENLYIYRRVAHSYTQEQVQTLLGHSPISATIVTSGELLKHLTTISIDQQTPVIVVGQRQAKLARTQGFTEVVVSPSADNKILIETLLTNI